MAGAIERAATLREYGEALRAANLPWGDEIIEAADVMADEYVAREDLDGVTQILDGAKIVACDNVTARVESVLAEIDQIDEALDGGMVWGKDDSRAKRIERVLIDVDAIADTLTDAGLIDDSTPRSDWPSLIAMFLPSP